MWNKVLVCTYVTIFKSVLVCNYVAIFKISVPSLPLHSILDTMCVILGSRYDQKCIFVTPETHVTTLYNFDLWQQKLGASAWTNRRTVCMDRLNVKILIYINSIIDSLQIVQLSSQCSLRVLAHLCYASYRSLSKFEYNGSKLNCNLLTSAITNMITFPNWFISAQQCEKWCWDYETLNRRSTFLCRHNSTIRLAEVYDFFSPI